MTRYDSNTASGVRAHKNISIQINPVTEYDCKPAWLLPLLLLLAACGSNIGADNVNRISGQAQKGPFVAGTPVLIYHVDDTASRIGAAATATLGESGDFTANFEEDGLTEVEISGEYFNEITGATALTPITLNSIIRLSGATHHNINLFTHIAAGRVRTLMQAGTDYDTARAQAQNELSALFGLELPEHARLCALSLTDGTSINAADNANLLLFSSAMLLAGFGQTELDLLREDFADDGVIDSAADTLWSTLRIMGDLVNLDTVRTNLLSLPFVADPPDMADMHDTLPIWVTPLDSDGDGLSDGTELNHTHTDPLLADTDDDTMPDGWEVTHNLDPLADDGNDDADDDGLVNADEHLNATDPHNPDTDADGMPDGWEIDHDLAPLTPDSDLDPDGDTLTNLVEYRHGTDPHLADTDGDGYPDDVEISGVGGNPVDAGIVPLYFTSDPLTGIETGFAYVDTATTSWSGVEYTLLSAPAGLVIDPETGLLGWLPGFGTEGDYEITIQASRDGNSVTQTYSLHVETGNTGDLNEDGTVDLKDYLLAVRIVLGKLAATGNQAIRGDMYPDGVLNLSDVLAIERTALGLADDS